MTDHAVMIAGGGPTGQMLAGELALVGVDVALVGRRVNQDLATSGQRHGGPVSNHQGRLTARRIRDQRLRG